jgi:hypothetical protein
MFVQRARTLRSTLAPNIGLKKLKDMVFHALLHMYACCWATSVRSMRSTKLVQRELPTADRSRKRCTVPPGQQICGHGRNCFVVQPCTASKVTQKVLVREICTIAQEIAARCGTKWPCAEQCQQDFSIDCPTVSSS